MSTLVEKDFVSPVTNTDRAAVKMLVRAREDFQAMRKRMDNRIGRKADGSQQDIEERAFRADDVANFAGIADEARKQEHQTEKMLRKVLKRFPVYTEFLEETKGVGEIASGHIIGEIDIHIASNVSKLWQFCGLNPGMVRGKKRVENKDGTFSLVPTDELIRGDRKTPGFVAPFNINLRTALVGVLADGFIKAQAPYALDYYYPYKERLAHSENQTHEMKKGGKVEDKAWKDCTLGHRDRAAKRYMIKMFLKDLYVAWRELEGLPVRAPYQEQYLGHKHVS